jgi:hypothetical protein
MVWLLVDFRGVRYTGFFCCKLLWRGVEGVGFVGCGWVLGRMSCLRSVGLLNGLLLLAHC